MFAVVGVVVDDDVGAVWLAMDANTSAHTSMVVVVVVVVVGIVVVVGQRFAALVVQRFAALVSVHVVSPLVFNCSLLVLVRSGSRTSQIVCGAVCLVEHSPPKHHADAPVLVGGGVPAADRLLQGVVEQCRGEQLDLGGSALIKYGMLSFEHDVTQIKLLS
jgi:hypothetical protein